MSVLTRSEILKRMGAGDVSFSPEPDAFQIQPHAIDLRLGYKFYIPRNWMLTERGRKAIKTSIDDKDIHKEQFDTVELKPGQYFELLPNEFVIATTLEKIELNASDLFAVLFPRTSSNRRGVSLSHTGIIDCGYKGHLIMPMKNDAGDQVLRMYPGERVCQIILQKLNSNMSIEEAQLHGAQMAKYQNGDSAMYKLDKDDERELLISGKLDELKEKFKI